MNPFLSAPPALLVAGGPPLYDQRDLALWTRLSLQPIYPVPIPTITASRELVNRECMIVGISLRETSGTAAAQVELINGTDTTGEVVAEVTLPAPLLGSVGNTDTQVTASATGTTGSINAALAGVAGQTTFVSGFEITGSGATAGVTGIATLAGTISGTLSYDWGVPTGATLPATPLVVEFVTPVAASGLNQAITLTVPASGAGATQIACAIHGFQRLVGSTAAQTGVSIPQSFPTPGVLCRSGLFLRVITGSVVGSAWVRV